MCYWRRCCERCQPTQQWACAGTGAGRRTSQFNSELVTLTKLPQGCLSCGQTVQKWAKGTWQSPCHWWQKDEGAAQQPCRAADLRGFVKSPEFRRSDFAFSFSFDLKISEIFYHSVFRKTSGWVPGLRKHFHNHFRKVFGKKIQQMDEGLGIHRCFHKAGSGSPRTEGAHTATLWAVSPCTPGHNHDQTLAEAWRALSSGDTTPTWWGGLCVVSEPCSSDTTASRSSALS